MGTDPSSRPSWFTSDTAQEDADAHFARARAAVKAGHPWYLAVGPAKDLSWSLFTRTGWELDFADHRSIGREALIPAGAAVIEAYAINRYRKHLLAGPAADLRFYLAERLGPLTAPRSVLTGNGAGFEHGVRQWQWPDLIKTPEKTQHPNVKFEQEASNLVQSKEKVDDRVAWQRMVSLIEEHPSAKHVAGEKAVSDSVALHLSALMAVSSLHIQAVMPSQ